MSNEQWSSTSHVAAEIHHRTRNAHVAVRAHAAIQHAHKPVYKYFPSTPPRRSAPADRSMIGLLALTAIPTTIAVSEAIAERDKKHESDPLKEARQMRKFAIRCYCAGSSPGKRDVHQGALVVGDGAVYVRSANMKGPPPKPLMPAEAFYVEYPDPERTPAVLGMVTKVKTDPPLLNWIYIDEKTQQVRHANRSGSISHWVGDFGATDGFEAVEEGEEEEPAGITFDGEERFVVVQPRKGSTEEKQGLWEIWWDEGDDKLGNGKKVDGRLVLRMSLERDFIEEEGA